MTFTELERAYLEERPLGRLATVDPEGRPQNSPVTFRFNPGAGTIDVTGEDLGESPTFRNVAATGVAALVVDDLVSVDPWRVRGVEIRGRAEALAGADGEQDGHNRCLIRIHPTTIFSWGLDPDNPRRQRRQVAGTRG